MGKVLLESKCKVPCRMMTFHVKQTKMKTSLYPTHWLELNFEDTVEMLEEQSNYTGFDLIVEIGSSLGLWVGISVIGIFDLFTEFATKSAMFYKAFCSKPKS